MRNSFMGFCARFIVPFAIVLIASGFNSAFAAIIGPFDFSSDAQYSNNNPATSGQFRDFVGPTRINRGGHLVGTTPANTTATGAFPALNFTGANNNATGPLGAFTLFDQNVTDADPTLFTGNISLSADILSNLFDNARSAGFVFLFNEGAGQEGLALLLWNNGNSDALRLHEVQQTGIVGRNEAGTTLAGVALGSGVPLDVWLRLTVDLVIVGDNFTVTGKVFAHSTPADPNSALGAQVGPTLVYNNTLSGLGLLNPFEIGLGGRPVNADISTSVTNLLIDGTLVQQQQEPVPEPASLALFGAAVAAGFLGWRRRRLAAAS